MIRAIQFCVCLIVLSQGLAGQLSLPAPVDSLIRLGMDAALRQSYGDAERWFREASAIDKHQPAGVVFLAGLLYQRAEDLGEQFDRRSFDSLLTEAEVRARFREAEAPDDIWIPLLRATARGMLAVAEAGSGEWMAAVRDALNSSSEAEDVWEMDSSLADAGLPLGNYLYWKSRKTEALHWLPLFTDDRSEGVRLLELCARSGRYHRFAAISSLIWILHDARELERAAAWARTGLASYPENRNVQAGLAMVEEAQGRFGEASGLWGRIAHSLARSGNGTGYAAFSSSVNQLRCLLKAGDRSAARGLAQRIVEPGSSTIPSSLARRFDAKRKEWTLLRMQIEPSSSAPSTSESRP